VSYLYKAFGEQSVLSGSHANPFTWVGRLGYYRQADLDNYWLRARTYNQLAGRFLSRDPVPNGNLYIFPNNSPIVLVDPSGMQPECTSFGPYGLKCECGDEAGWRCGFRVGRHGPRVATRSPYVPYTELGSIRCNCEGADDEEERSCEVDVKLVKEYRDRPKRILRERTVKGCCVPPGMLGCSSEYGRGGKGGSGRGSGPDGGGGGNGGGGGSGGPGGGKGGGGNGDNDNNNGNGNGYNDGLKCDTIGWDFSLSPRPYYRLPAGYEWGSQPATWDQVAFQGPDETMVALGSLLYGGLKTMGYVWHWAGNTGVEILENIEDIFRHNSSEKTLCTKALRCAANFVESHIESLVPRRIMTKKQERYGFTNTDWHCAIGGHVSYAYAWARADGYGGFIMRFRWVLEDTFTTKDKLPDYFHRLHTAGLAHDFWVTSRR